MTSVEWHLALLYSSLAPAKTRLKRSLLHSIVFHMLLTIIQENGIQLNNDSKKWRSGLFIFFYSTIRIYDDWVKWCSAMSLFGKTTSHQWNDVSGKRCGPKKRLLKRMPGKSTEGSSTIFFIFIDCSHPTTFKSMWNTAVGIKNCKQLFSLWLAFTTQKKATHTAEMMSVVCVAIFWVVNASSSEKKLFTVFDTDWVWARWGGRCFIDTKRYSMRRGVFFQRTFFLRTSFRALFSKFQFTWLYCS